MSACSRVPVRDAGLSKGLSNGLFITMAGYKYNRVDALVDGRVKICINLSNNIFYEKSSDFCEGQGKITSIVKLNYVNFLVHKLRMRIEISPYSPEYRIK